ncbi:MAG: LysM peptidoglycan-binding domain-containing protein [Opitutaceae bacterium]
MKILKIFGIVVGIHVFLLVLVFAIPGCSSSVKPAPTAADTAPTPAAPAPAISVPLPANGDAAAATPTVIAFDPDAPAAAAPAVAAESGVRFVPTRPDTPAAGTLVAQSAEGVIPATSYTVKSGDNLWTIAKKNNLTVAQLTAANPLAAKTSLHPGQKLIIPSKAVTAAPASGKAAEVPASATKSSSAKSADGMKHTVKPGETLGGIARTYGVRQGDIAVANNISDPAKIRPGMELIIPGWEPSKGTKAGKATTKSGGATKAGDGKTPAAPPVAPTVEIAPAPTITVPMIRIEEGTPSSPPNR